jgi:hypothetical protein
VVAFRGGHFFLLCREPAKRGGMLNISAAIWFLCGLIDFGHRSIPERRLSDVKAGIGQQKCPDSQMLDRAFQTIGAEEGTRTPTPLRVHGPEPCASANSATSARVTADSRIRDSAFSPAGCWTAAVASLAKGPGNVKPCKNTETQGGSPLCACRLHAPSVRKGEGPNE